MQAIPITEQYPHLADVEALSLEAFPQAEYLSPARMIAMAAEEGFDFWALEDDGAFTGYMTVMTNRKTAYLFFLAVAPKQRNRGNGSKALRLMKTLYPDLQQVVDLERQDEHAENSAQRRRRRQFYLSNGYRPTRQFLTYMGVDYEVLCTEDDFDAASFRSLLKDIRIEGFHPVYFTAPVPEDGR